MTWRKAWAADWSEVRYCSDACRRRKVRPVDERLEAAIVDLLGQRAGGATICPSEAARAVDPDSWRELMEPAVHFNWSIRHRQILKVSAAGINGGEAPNTAALRERKQPQSFPWSSTRYLPIRTHH